MGVQVPLLCLPWDECAWEKNLRFGLLAWHWEQSEGQTRGCHALDPSQALLSFLSVGLKREQP